MIVIHFQQSERNNITHKDIFTLVYMVVERLLSWTILEIPMMLRSMWKQLQPSISTATASQVSNSFIIYSSQLNRKYFYRSYTYTITSELGTILPKFSQRMTQSPSGDARSVYFGIFPAYLVFLHVSTPYTNSFISIA